MMKEREILQALQTATIAAVAASVRPTLPIKMLGRTFTPPNDGKWLEVVYIPNNVNDIGWGEEKLYRGMFRLILHWKNEDAGFYEPLNVISSVSSYFNKGKRLDNGDTSVEVSDNPDLLSTIENGSEFLFPVSIRYQSFQP